MDPDDIQINTQIIEEFIDVFYYLKIVREDQFRVGTEELDKAMRVYFGE